MTVEDITNNENKNASEELIDMIDSFVMTYKVTTEERDKQVKAIIEKGRAEELSDKQIRGLIEVSLRKHGISDRTIRRALPDELKNINMIRESKPRALEDKIPDRVEQSVPVPEIAQDSSTTIDEDSTTEITDQSVYREPDRIEPKPEWIPTTKPELEQSYHTMNVPDKSQIPSSEWIVHNQPSDYTVTTQLQIYNGTGNNIGQFTVDVVAKCYPSKKTVVLEPIDKSSIVKVR